MDNLNPQQFGQHRFPNCVHCGESLRVTPKPHWRDGRVIPNDGWSHHDGMKRDHLATPPPGVTAESQRAADQAARDQARVAVRERLNEQFLALSVDKIFEHPDVT